MQNTFIRLSGKNSENRASTLFAVHNALTIKYGTEKHERFNNILHNELISTYQINGERVGLISHQDPNQNPFERVNQLFELSYSIILFTSINIDSKSESFNSILHQRNFKTIELSPIWSKAMEFDCLVQVEVENMIEMIELLTEKNIETHSKNKSQLIIS